MLVVPSYVSVYVAIATTIHILDTLGSTKCIKSVGRTSGTPPTFVLTTCKLRERRNNWHNYSISYYTNPQHAASTIAIQKASVIDVLRNISPCTNTYRITITINNY